MFINNLTYFIIDFLVQLSYTKLI